MRSSPQPEFLNVYGAKEPFPINQPPDNVAWWSGTITPFLLGSLPPIDYLKIPALVTMRKIKFQQSKTINPLIATILLVTLWKIKFKESKTIIPLNAFVPLS